MPNTKIQASIPFTYRDSEGVLYSYGKGEIADIDSTLATSFINAGLATAYTLITPTGKKSITENGTGIDVASYATADVAVPNPSTGKVNITSTAEVDVTNYATAQVVDANLIAGNIKKDVVILGVTGSYEA